MNEGTVSPASEASAPLAILIAGANGAGKTSFARQMLPLLHPEVPFLNVDEIQQENESFRHPVAASKEFLRRLEAYVQDRKPFAIETTLSSPSYAHHVRAWHALGYETVLHFIEVPNADFAVDRVRERVQAGGHGIPEADIRRRFERGRQLFAGLFCPLVRQWYHWHANEEGISLGQENTERNP
jgi:predicted ABC-type ATPase